MADLDAMFDRNSELIEENWPTEDGRSKMQALQSKYYTGVHSDAVYTVVTELIK